jgi:hypothetical protein
MPHTRRSWSLVLPVLAACALALTACSSSPSTSSSATTSTSTTSRPPTSTPTTSSSLAPQTATSTEFYSPSKNISCEIDNDFGPSALTSALCLTISPPKSVTLNTDGSLTTCTGVDCLSNAGVDTPTLAYGQSVTLGLFTCASSTAGVKCTLHSGQGFLISKSATTAVGGATVTTSTTSTSG